MSNVLKVPCSVLVCVDGEGWRGKLCEDRIPTRESPDRAKQDDDVLHVECFEGALLCAGVCGLQTMHQKGLLGCVVSEGGEGNQPDYPGLGERRGRSDFDHLGRG